MSLTTLNKSIVQKKPSLKIPTTEKVLQFGTGVLLRGLPDYFIHKANQEDVFNGSIVVIKSTSTGGVDDFANQDSLFTHCVRGVYNGASVDDCFINTSISRVLAASENWNQIIELAKSEDIEIVVSNTTEAGLVYDENDIFTIATPKSFPGKLLALLYERWLHFNNDVNKGWVILPTELLPDNGNLLKSILNKLASINKMPTAFVEWMNVANEFCNTLVDRIVPGKVSDDELQVLEQKFGYKDNLLITSEPFALWAIEANKASTIEKLSFAKIDESIVVVPSIVKFREIKLRLLNGTHTFSCAVAILAGFETVTEAINDKGFNEFIKNLMLNEIVPCVMSSTITEEEAIQFSNKVIERFANPYIQHKWISIALNFEEKMKMRNGHLLETFAAQHQLPSYWMSLGFAAFCVYMEQAHQKEIKIEDYCNNQLFITQVAKWINEIKAKGMKNILAA
ncbi:MAG: tagaturonate reductase [Chitinophagaceae bacterium]|nr:tagaturonate reductase [Chitinophagaceae bacterium]